MANIFATLPRSIVSRPLLKFLKALQLKKAAQTPMILENTQNPLESLWDEHPF